MGYGTYFTMCIRKVEETDKTMMDVVRALAEISTYDWMVNIEACDFYTGELKERDEYNGGDKALTNKEFTIEYALTDIVKLNSDEYISWYDHDADMRQLAKMFPEFSFTLEGEGEDRFDWWLTYYHGKIRRACEAMVMSPWETMSMALGGETDEDIRKDLRKHYLHYNGEV